MTKREPWYKSIQISEGTLKWFAIITMFIDHIGACLIFQGIYRSTILGYAPAQFLSPESKAIFHDVYYVLRGIGRLSFPIFCFFIVEGFQKTRSVPRYALRLFLFGLISEIPFDLAIGGKPWYPSHQNVMFTMFFGLLTLYGIRYFWNGYLENITWRAVFGVSASIAIGCAAAHYLKTDYGYKGIILIVVLYLFRERRDVQCITGAAAIAWENWAYLAFIPLYFYNGERGRQSKYFFYVFYPAHFLLLYCIARFGIPRVLGL